MAVLLLNSERMHPVVFPPRGRRIGPVRPVWFLLALILIFLVTRWASSLILEWAWWNELNQVDTWVNLFTYAYLPLTVATLVASAFFWLTHRSAMVFAGVDRKAYRTYARIASLAFLFIGWILSASTLETWTIVRYFGSHGASVPADVFRDPAFHRPLGFYLFELPFYSSLRQYLLAIAVICALLFWITARAWQVGYRFREIRDNRDIDISLLRLPGGLESRFLRAVIAIVLLAFATQFFLGRYSMVWNDHGFMVGIDWLDEHVSLPLQWVLTIAALIAAVLSLFGRWRIVLSLFLLLPIAWVSPRLVSALYVKPNEISLESPYIEQHIHATRNAYGIEKRVREVEYKTVNVSTLDVNKHRALLDNVRLWDWRPFHDTVTQTQALRPYYVFHDTDIDRYTIDGQYRQTLVAPRELDVSQLRNAGWINQRFIYTHGYGVVLAEVSRITADGLPVFLVQNMPPEVSTPSLKFARPQLYYGEVTHEPVFVRTAQPEFDYPSGAENVKTRYSGRGGFPISPLWMRFAASVHEVDANILLTNYLTPESRMMIHRNIMDRVHSLAPFLEWDPDPYLVISDSGRLVWMIDGYTVSDANPYSRLSEVTEGRRINYIRNSVKATIDAYDGNVNVYIFDRSDPIIAAYRNLFPGLFQSRDAMPADLRKHTRYPEILFRIQADIYRAYHMLSPQAFYNREDLWELAKYSSSQDKPPEPVAPTYVVAALPGEDTPEFLLMTSYTPASKDNLIGVMLARCDGEHLGDIRVLLLSKQQLTLGPMQVAARINQDENISKDLTLWNQQGSQVLRGQMLVLPIENTFLYVEPIYIQSTQARMPQLRKVVLYLGNRLIYKDTYERALAELASGGAGAAPAIQTSAATQPAPAAQPTERLTIEKIVAIRNHLRRYRELAAQGKWADAGRELEAIENEVK